MPVAPRREPRRMAGRKGTWADGIEPFVGRGEALDSGAGALASIQLGPMGRLSSSLMWIVPKSGFVWQGGQKTVRVLSGLARRTAGSSRT